MNAIEGEHPMNAVSDRAAEDLRTMVDFVMRGDLDGAKEWYTRVGDKDPARRVELLAAWCWHRAGVQRALDALNARRAEEGLPTLARQGNLIEGEES
jgi:hypothetical protein